MEGTSKLCIRITEQQPDRMAHVAPVQRIPPEILSEIFLQCVDTDDHTLAHAGRILSPFLFGKICSRWRSVSLSTPRLWASFNLTLYQRRQSKVTVARTTLMAKNWLARAGACSLSISFASYLDSQISLQPLIQVFVLHCDRWRDINFSLPQSEIMHLSPARNCMPRLQRLVFSLRSDLLSGTEAIDTFEYAPQLHSLDLTNMVPSSFKVPYYQLKHSDLRGRGADGILQFLSLTSNLETCKIAPMTSDLHRPPVLLPNLRSIDMTIRGDLSNFFDRLLLPKLRELHVTLWNVPWTAVPQFISLISRGSLEKLTFYSNPTNRHPYDGDMIKVLQAVPSIVQLELIGSTPQCMTKLFLAQFTCHQQSNDADPPMILPMLRSITVDYTASFFDILAFADAIQSRMVDGTGQSALEAVSGACLKTVQIRCFPPFEAKTSESLGSIGLSRLQQLQNLGVDLSIIYGRNGCGEFTKL